MIRVLIIDRDANRQRLLELIITQYWPEEDVVCLGLISAEEIVQFIRTLSPYDFVFVATDIAKGMPESAKTIMQIMRLHNPDSFIFAVARYEHWADDFVSAPWDCWLNTSPGNGDYLVQIERELWRNFDGTTTRNNRPLHA